MEPGKSNIQSYSSVWVLRTGSNLRNKTGATLEQKDIGDFKTNSRQGEHPDFEKWKGDDQGTTETPKQASTRQEPVPDTGKARKKKLSLKALFVSLGTVRSKLQIFVRKLSGKSERRKSDRQWQSLASVRSPVPAKIIDDDVQSSNGTPTSTKDVSASKSPINETASLNMLEREKITSSSLQNDRDLELLIESESENDTLSSEEADYDERPDDVPHRVRSKLPSEEKLPYIEPGTVSATIAQLNSVSCFEFRQASMLLKKKDMLPHSLTRFQPKRLIASPVGKRFRRDSPDTVSDVLSPTRVLDSSGSHGRSNRSESFEFNTGGPVSFLRTLLQEKDNPSTLCFRSLSCGRDKKAGIKETTHIKSIKRPSGPILCTTSVKALIAGVDALEAKSNEESGGQTLSTQPQRPSSNTVEQVVRMQITNQQLLPGEVLLNKPSAA